MRIIPPLYGRMYCIAVKMISQNYVSPSYWTRFNPIPKNSNWSFHLPPNWRRWNWIPDNFQQLVNILRHPVLRDGSPSQLPQLHPPEQLTVNHFFQTWRSGILENLIYRLSHLWRSFQLQLEMSWTWRRWKFVSCCHFEEQISKSDGLKGAWGFWWEAKEGVFQASYSSHSVLDDYISGMEMMERRKISAS